MLPKSRCIQIPLTLSLKSRWSLFCVICIMISCSDVSDWMGLRVQIMLNWTEYCSTVSSLIEDEIEIWISESRRRFRQPELTEHGSGNMWLMTFKTVPARFHQWVKTSACDKTTVQDITERRTLIKEKKNQKELHLKGNTSSFSLFYMWRIYSCSFFGWEMSCIFHFSRCQCPQFLNLMITHGV